MGKDVEKVINSMIELNDRIKELTIEMEEKKKEIKEYMMNSNINKLESTTYAGRTCVLQTSVRKNCKNKSGLIAELVKENAHYCIKTVIEPDIGLLKEEKEHNNNLSNIYDKYIKEVKVVSLKIS